MRHLVRPQADGSDTRELIRRAEDRWGAPPEQNGEPFGGGPVVLRVKENNPAPWITDCPLDHPNIAAAAESMQRWPEAWASFSWFVTDFWPLGQDVPAGTRGSTSGHLVKDGRRVVHVTVFDVEGCRQGLLHEMGHLRLEAMGIDLETHDGRVLANADDEMFVSPIRKDKLRPMSAVIHGFYAWALMSQGDVYAHRAGVNVRHFAETNAPKLEEGLITLEKARWSGLEAEEFGIELMTWGRELADALWDIVGENREKATDQHRKWIAESEVKDSPLYS